MQPQLNVFKNTARLNQDLTTTTCIASVRPFVPMHSPAFIPFPNSLPRPLPLGRSDRTTRTSRASSPSPRTELPLPPRARITHSTLLRLSSSSRRSLERAETRLLPRTSQPHLHSLRWLPPSTRRSHRRLRRGGNQGLVTASVIVPLSNSVVPSAHLLPAHVSYFRVNSK